jgi:hypothetical protein
MNQWLDWITAIASLATAGALFVAIWQLGEGRKQARTDFEDELNREYREIIHNIPVKAFLGGELQIKTIKMHCGISTSILIYPTNRYFYDSRAGSVKTPGASGGTASRVICPGTHLTRPGKRSKRKDSKAFRN